jgi:hypothetical protein
MISAALIACNKKSDIRLLIENYALFVGQLNSTNANKAVFALYDLYRLPHPRYAIIHEELQDRMNEAFTALHPDAVKMKKRLMAEERRWNNYDSDS